MPRKLSVEDPMDDKRPLRFRIADSAWSAGEMFSQCQHCGLFADEEHNGPLRGRRDVPIEEVRAIFAERVQRHAHAFRWPESDEELAATVGQTEYRPASRHPEHPVVAENAPAPFSGGMCDDCAGEIGAEHRARLEALRARRQAEEPPEPPEGEGE